MASLEQHIQIIQQTDAVVTVPYTCCYVDYIVVRLVLKVKMVKINSKYTSI